MSNANNNYKSYGSDIYMKEDTYIDSVLDEIEDIVSLAKKTFDSIYVAEHEILQKKGEYSFVKNFNSYITQYFLDNTYSSKVYSDGGTVASYSEIFDDKIREKYDNDLYFYVKREKYSFGRLYGAIRELREAVSNYSKGIDVSSSIEIINTLNPGHISTSSYSGYSGSTYTAPTLSTTTVPAIDSIVDVKKTDAIDGAENIALEDSVTDNILNVSADNLLESAVKETNGDDAIISSKGLSSVLSGLSSGTASALSSAGVISTGLGKTSSVVSKIGKSANELKKKDTDEVIEAEEPITSLGDTDEDEDLLGEIVSDVESFVAPQVNTTINGKKVKSKSGASFAIPAVAGVGVASAGAIGGKVYMDKKNNNNDDENNDDDDENVFDDFEFDEQTNVENTGNDENVVDFKNKIMDDNL